MFKVRPYVWVLAKPVSQSGARRRFFFEKHPKKATAKSGRPAGLGATAGSMSGKRRRCRHGGGGGMGEEAGGATRYCPGSQGVERGRWVPL